MIAVGSAQYLAVREDDMLEAAAGEILTLQWVGVGALFAFIVSRLSSQGFCDVERKDGGVTALVTSSRSGQIGLVCPFFCSEADGTASPRQSLEVVPFADVEQFVYSICQTNSYSFSGFRVVVMLD